MIRERIEDYTWASQAMFAAELAADGTVLRANDALERFAGGPLPGTAAAELVASAQREAFERRLADVGEGWRSVTLALGVGRVSDREVWLRRAGDSVLLVAAPAVGEHERLTERVLELNDELVATHRELVAQRGELRRTADRLRDLEAIASAGLGGLPMDELIAEVLRIIAVAVGSERAVLLLRDEDEDELVARAAVGLESGARIPVGEGIVGRIAADGRPLVASDEPDGDGLGGRSVAGVPLTLDGAVIGVLFVASDEADRFGRDHLALLMPAAERAALAIGHARVVERERRIAETLQRSLLPRRLPVVEGLELAARFVPGAGVDVGGDWYDALPLPGGGLAVVIGDVAGKGLRAATMMGELRAGLRAYALDGRGPVDTLARLNRLAERSRHMATVVLMHVEAESVCFASAGHLPPLLVEPDGRARFLLGGAAAPLLAFRGDVEPARAALAPGARVVLYTDGLVERRREPIDEGLERLRGAAEGFAGGAEALCGHLMEALRPPAGAAHDDIALVALSRPS